MISRAVLGALVVTACTTESARGADVGDPCAAMEDCGGLPMTCDLLAQPSPFCTRTCGDQQGGDSFYCPEGYKCGFDEYCARNSGSGSSGSGDSKGKGGNVPSPSFAEEPSISPSSSFSSSTSSSINKTSTGARSPSSSSSIESSQPSPTMNYAPSPSSSETSSAPANMPFPAFASPSPRQPSAESTPSPHEIPAPAPAPSSFPSVAAPSSNQRPALSPSPLPSTPSSDQTGRVPSPYSFEAPSPSEPPTRSTPSPSVPEPNPDPDPSKMARSFGEACTNSAECGTYNTKKMVCLEDVDLSESYCTVEDCLVFSGQSTCPTKYSCLQESSQTTVCVKDLDVVSPSPEPVPEPENCVAWRQTGGCNPFGARETSFDKYNCNEPISKGASGFCECAGGTALALVTCDHDTFTCADVCNTQDSTAFNPVSLDSGRCGPACDMLGRCESFTDSTIKGLSGVCVCSSGVSGMDCSTPPTAFRYGSSATVLFSLDKVTLPLSMSRGKISKSKMQALQRSFGRAIAADIAEALDIDASRIDFYGEDNNWIRISGSRIQVALQIHAPLSSMPPSGTSNSGLGSTQEMNHLVDSLANQADQSWSKLRRDSVVMRRLDVRSLTTEVLAAPSLEISPQTIKIEADVSSWPDNVQGSIAKSFAITNSVENSNSAIVSKVYLLPPASDWVTISQPSASRVAYGTPVTVSVEVSKSLLKTMPSGNYFQAIGVRHNALQDAHTVQIYVTISNGKTDNGGSGDAPNAEWPSNWLLSKGYVPGLVSGVCIVLLAGCIGWCLRAVCRRFCCCCQSRATRLQRSNKRKGTPATKFSKITVLDDDDEINGVELSKTSGDAPPVMNEFGISSLRFSGSAGQQPLEPGKTSSAGAHQQGRGSTSRNSSLKSIELITDPSLDAEQFEPAWQSMKKTKLWGRQCTQIPSESEFEEMMLRINVHCMASGQVENTQKFYFYAQEKTSKTLYLIESSISTDSMRLSCVFKTSADGNLEAFMKLVSGLFSDSKLLL